jgi:DNA-binding transcriptional ArsR family regulator
MDLNIIFDQEEENQTYEQEVQVFKILSHPARLAILDILRDGEHCVCHMEAHLGFRQAYISQQLSVLREAGLIQDRRDGWNIFYQVTDRRIYTVIDAVRDLIGKNFQSIGNSSEVICNCPHCMAKRQ